MADIKVRCPICDTIYAVDEDGFADYSVCPECEWEQDNLANRDDDYSTPNKMTVAEARRTYANNRK